MRELVKAIRDAGGDVERAGRGQVRVTGPAGSLTMHEVAGETRRDLRRAGIGAKISAATGLVL